MCAVAVIGGRVTVVVPSIVGRTFSQRVHSGDPVAVLSVGAERASRSIVPACQTARWRNLGYREAAQRDFEYFKARSQLLQPTRAIGQVVDVLRDGGRGPGRKSIICAIEADCSVASIPGRVCAYS
jgi:hypothetical protein